MSQAAVTADSASSGKLGCAKRTSGCVHEVGVAEGELASSLNSITLGRMHARCQAAFAEAVSDTSVNDGHGMMIRVLQAVPDDLPTVWVESDTSLQGIVPRAAVAAMELDRMIARTTAQDGGTSLQGDFDTKGYWPHRSPDGTSAGSEVHAWHSPSALDCELSAIVRARVKYSQLVLLFQPEAMVVCRLQLLRHMAKVAGRYKRPQRLSDQVKYQQRAIKSYSLGDHLLLRIGYAWQLAELIDRIFRGICIAALPWLLKPWTPAYMREPRNVNLVSSTACISLSSPGMFSILALDPEFSVDSPVECTFGKNGTESTTAPWYTTPD
ncbi:hypothetical protein DE146DRAFT_739449 [Phaeosphaeria sp. MPI-PUGE-AT-0046c]|nr:hypothetical protein DE146DRAFT_739449 [Phaeosphaeria sp. MPI-PUGE-AT-0046c]